MQETVHTPHQKRREKNICVYKMVCGCQAQSSTGITNRTRAFSPPRRSTVSSTRTPIKREAQCPFTSDRYVYDRPPAGNKGRTLRTIQSELQSAKEDFEYKLANDLDYTAAAKRVQQLINERKSLPFAKSNDMLLTYYTD